MHTTTRSFINDRAGGAYGANSSMIIYHPTQEAAAGHTLTQQSFLVNRVPSTFDAREESKRRNLNNNCQESATESDTAFQSDECDEKRSYTPQPR